MSSSGRDGSAMKPTADETVPLMNDTTNEELLFYKFHSIWSAIWSNDFIEINSDDDDDTLLSA